MSGESNAEPIPESWPPEDPSDVTRRVVPLFALPHVWLFPYVILPLHIFEERYKQMIQDILDGPGRIVLATVQDGHEDDLAGSPPVYPIAGLGEIGRQLPVSGQADQGGEDRPIGGVHQPVGGGAVAGGGGAEESKLVVSAELAPPP